MINALLSAVKQYGKVINFNESTNIRKITQDTRTINENDIYIAIIGDNFDGHDFIQDAIEKRRFCYHYRKRNTKQCLSICCTKYLSIYSISSKYLS